MSHFFIIDLKFSAHNIKVMLQHFNCITSAFAAAVLYIHGEINLLGDLGQECAVVPIVPPFLLFYYLLFCPVYSLVYRDHTVKCHDMKVDIGNRLLY